MDRFIGNFPAEADRDLILCRDHGVAYQADMTNLCAYDDAYYAKFASHDQAILEKVNAGRVAFVSKIFGAGKVIDVGIGDGQFIKHRPNTYGHDVNPAGIEWLKRNDLWARSLSEFGAATFWDVIEHVETPEQYLRQINLHSFAFFSLPIFYALGAIRASKHYRPGEHLYYWTEDGFVAWMDLHGFRLVELQDFEIQAGRESILSFAFRRYRWYR